MTETVESAETLASALLTAAGMEPARARTSARCIVMADVWGIGSHGLMRLPYYLQRMVAGGYPADAELRVVDDTGPVVSATGGGGLGHWQLWQSAELAAQRCGQYGIGAVSVADSGHCGALGLYTVPGLRHGLLTLAFSNGPAVMPPWGGAKPLLSTSPLAAGIPTRPRPAIVDMATSAVARGKIAAHARSGTRLPEGWALAADGTPTIDPQEALYGMLAPLGGAKGFALALLVESIAGGLAGPNLAADVPDMFTESDAPSPQRIGHVLLTLDPARFTGDGDAAARRLDRLAASVEDAGGRLPGRDRVLPDDVDPGVALAIDDKTVRELREWADRLGVG
ncbi:Ldh family oxidoreductase [Prauserella cavernicola]|uniref:Ldh family oxidoreductase n=1 Tax=Prauserella cavernicola TaxID=2800127 RepID=A0A934QPA9_9PSEU|nr:Ldh family oxidoreductase [Prauserella cavernicola]MBK1783662.1 Ldh family oxidoreductase [Prauserella cavernicola]